MATPRWVWLEAGIILFVLAALAAAWKWTALSELADPEQLRAALAPYRTRWFGPLVVIAVFVLAELLIFPLVVLIFVCGLAFGPWLGALYAMLGAVASAIIPFLIGRWLGPRRVERWGGSVTRKLSKALHRKGMIAVFFVRKIPAPYSIVNLICGASGLTLRDFIVGTVLGMAMGVVLITVVGAGLGEIFSNPKPLQLVIVLAVLAGTWWLTLWLQKIVNRRLDKAA